MKKDKNIEYVQKLRMGGVNNKAMTYINDLRPVTPSAPSENTDKTDYLCFTATGESTIGLTNSEDNAPVLFYSTDKKNWVSWDYSTITLNDGESVYFYGENPNGFNESNFKYSFFSMTGSIAASGNIQTLLSQNGDREDVTEYCFSYLFKNCTSLTTAPELPATTLAGGCYSSMFRGCSSLTTAPELPATTLANLCYQNIFNGCTSLTTAPVLPATTLTNFCYNGMFQGCTSLTETPTLPATTLANSCYDSMFYGCTSLTTAPVLPATTLVNFCYSHMFQNCTNLQSVTTYATTWNTSNANSWLYNAGTNATKPKLYCPAALFIRSDNPSGIPEGWTRVNL